MPIRVGITVFTRIVVANVQALVLPSRYKKQERPGPQRAWPGGMDSFTRIAHDGLRTGKTSQQYTQRYGTCSRMNRHSLTTRSEQVMFLHRENLTKEL